MRKNSKLRLILHILMALCAVGALCSAYILISDSREYAAGDASYREVRGLMKASEPASDNTAPQEIGGGAPEEDDRSGGVDFSVLKKINPDTAAWITSADRIIDYPVVLGADNDYYLRRLFTGESNKLGSIFMDYRSHADFSDRNTILYGHNMKDGSMFASITKYRNQSYYGSFPSMELYTPGGDYTIELFAGLVVDGDYESVRLDFKDDADFLRYIASLKRASTFKSDTVISAGDRIVTLCTCSYEFNNARYALFGKLEPAHRSP